MILAGHEEPRREWQAALAGPRLHHGWILTGKRGIGKAAFALAAARELVAEAGVPQPHGDHPDVIVLEPLPATTGVCAPVSVSSNQIEARPRSFMMSNDLREYAIARPSGDHAGAPR